MEGGQKIDINLESPLDTKSSDMLVSVKDTRFAHNRQKYQGHVLPTSLRYERNGWAAGWYVYDFQMGGGHIFSRNDNTLRGMPVWLAAGRSKLNNTPTYCLSMYTAFGADTREEIKHYADAIKTKQFEAWYTEKESINARECADATITGDPSPRLHFNYAVEDTDYIRDFVYSHDVIADTHTFTRQGGSSADLTLTYKDMASDGTVTALLENNDVRWAWSTDLYVPGDFYDSDGNKFGKFTDVNNRIVTWQLGNQTLTYSDITGQYTYNNTAYAQDQNLTVTFDIDLTYTIPIEKYYSKMSDIAWTVQGTRALFNSEDESDPCNRYSIDTTFAASSINIYDKSLVTTGFDGPDVSIMSVAEFDVSGITNDRYNIHFNVAEADDIVTSQSAIKCTIPVTTISVPGFKMPGSSEEHDAMLQLYIKYNDQDAYIDAGTIRGISCRAYPLSYDFANMSLEDRLKEPLYVDQNTDSISYKVDNEVIASSMSTDYININSDSNNNKPRIASRDIVGRLTKFTGAIKKINGTELSTPIDLSAYGINTNLAFSEWRPDYQWNTGGEYTGYNCLDHNLATSATLFGATGRNSYITMAEDGSVNWAGWSSSSHQGESDSYYTGVTCSYGYTPGSESGGVVTYPSIGVGVGVSGIFELGGIRYVLIRRSDYTNLTNNFKYYFIPLSDLSRSCSIYAWDHTDAQNHTSHYTYFVFGDSVFDSNYLVFNANGTSASLYQVLELNDIPTDLHGGVGNYGVCALGSNNGTRQLQNAMGTVMDFHSGTSNLGVVPGVTMNDITGIWNDRLHGELQITNGSTVKTFLYQVMNYWVGFNSYPEGIAHITDINAPLFCIDVVDKVTGEVLVDHNLDTVDFEDADLAVYLQEENAYTGKLFYNNNLNPNTQLTVPLSDAQVKRIYKFGNKSLAFFPIQKDNTYAARSVYKYSADQVHGTSQGIAVFNVEDAEPTLNVPYKYMFTLLSPLCNYATAPLVDAESNTLKVFAKRTFTHNIKLSEDAHKLITTLSAVDCYFIDDNTTDMSKLTVAPRSSIYSGADARFETDNKYYEDDKFFIVPASIAYYNNQIHITYKANTGNSITIAGSVYDLGSSDVSIKQDANLTIVYLPKYAGTGNKYNFVLGDHDNILNVKEAKELINNIEDPDYHYAIVLIGTISFTDNPAVMLWLQEYHSAGAGNPLRFMSYDSSLVHSESYVNSDYSNDTQFLIDSKVTGSTVIHLPVMPASGSFAHDITNGEAHLTQNANNYLDYDYMNNNVKKMVIKGAEVAQAACNLINVDDTHETYKKYSISVDQSINTLIYFKRYGIYKLAVITTGGITPKVNSIAYGQNKHEITFNVSDLVYIGTAEPVPMGNNINYLLNTNNFADPDECTPRFLDYTATDIRDDNPVTQTKKFARVDADNEYQLIRQHWDATVQTENFWWIDPEHTLKLTKDRFILEEKDIDAGYDDWDGDVWKVVAEYNRTDFITSDADIYICSSASGAGARGYLYILQPETENSIRVTIYDPLNNMTKVLTRTITFEHVELGTAKKHIALNSVNSTSNDLVVGTYSDILSATLLVDCHVSAVCINGVHWLGIQYDRNFNQWAFALGTPNKIIQGYGCIGINGYATGGMIPAEYFNGTGFSDVVYNIKELEAEEDQTLTSLDSFNMFKKRVVGDENQQWYVSEELKNIVMAVDLVKGTTVNLPLTNKYAQVYASPSYGKYSVHALGIQIKQLLDLFTDESNSIWQEIIKYAMFPLVWYLSPYTNVINYLQQTLGQYAFVHYNSTSIGKQSSKQFEESTESNAGLSEDEAGSHIDALITDDLSFDVVHIPQEQSFKDSAWDNVLGIFASMVVSATDYAMKDLTVNSLQNQSAVSDIGKKFSQSFLQNIGSMSVTGFNMQSTKPMLKSEVTAVKTLDMFYSTSAQQNCYAGPGFVNMQFVAQCVAQSVTSVQLEAQQTQVFVLLKQLTTWQGKSTIFMLDMLKDFLFKQSDNMAVNIMGTMPGVIAGTGWIAALVLSALGYATVAAKALVKLGIETVDSMLDSFFPGGIKTNVTAQLSRHNYDIEGKHAYGNKSECFMWPCADCKSKLYTDESVEAVLQDKSWPLEMPKTTSGNTQFKPIYLDQPNCYTITPSLLNSTKWEGQVPYSIAMCKGAQKRRALPDSTAFVIGTETFMPSVPFKNENIGEGEPVFTPPPVQDYLIDKNWNLFITAMAGEGLWVSCKDTKLFDGDYSNIVVTDSFCGVAAPHIAVEIKREICEEYLRPWAVSPDAIALNITGLNCAYEEVAHHAFDGYGYRITDWLGSSGMNKEHYTLQYCFQINDRFKRSNKLPPNQFMGNFQAVPSMSLDIKDKVFNDIQVTSEKEGMRTGVAGENKDTQRYSLPVFTESVSSLPAIVRALSPYKLAVIDGITSLTTDVRISQSAYKMPVSVDFNINDKLYRMTNEYICSVDHEKGLEVVKYLVPALGLIYLGATPFMAYFYNQATRQYFIYQGGNTLQMLDMLERFRDIKSGTYDFINQEVVMPCLATFDRLDRNVKDDTDETDNIIIPVFRHNNVAGEVTPPITTIFNTRSWFKTVSLPSGLAFQGPNRCIINRFVWSHYMLKDIIANKGKWKKVPREVYHPYRQYSQKYEKMPDRIASEAVKGWTHNPFLLVTAPLGVNEETDCMFEWEITFAWTVEMEQIYAANEYVVVNIVAETMASGGKVFSRPTHVFLTKDLFTRTGNFGYYSFRYQSNNGMGNRERLHIWSDGYIAVSSVQLEYLPKTEKRNDILTIQEDVKGMKEM